MNNFTGFPFKDFSNTYDEVTRIRESFHWKATQPVEQAVLYDLASGWHGGEAGYILEIGTDYGSSTTVMACAALNNAQWLPIFTLDLYQYFTIQDIPNLEKRSRMNNRLRSVRERFHEFDLHNKICQIISHDKTYLSHWHLPIRLVFIDGSHSYNGVKRDVNMTIKHVVDHGWIVFHDYEPGHGEVVQAVDTFIDSQPEDSIKTFGQGSMVIVQKVGDLCPIE